MEKTHLFGQGGGATTAGTEMPLSWRNTLHEEVRLGGDHGTPIVVANPKMQQARK